MTIERGPYESKKRAMSVSGKLFKHDGAIYRALSVSATKNVSFDDQWFATVEAREATAEELVEWNKYQLQTQLDKAVAAWSDDPRDPTAAETRAEVRRLRAEIAAMETAQ